jgi:hypothetical protein
MGVNPDAGSSDAFADKMRLEEPPPLAPELITIPPLIPLPAISRDLKKLVDKAFKMHGGKILDDLMR